MYCNQSEYLVKFEWGLDGLLELMPISDIVVIVDVLSFSTCVDIATGLGARVYPYRWKDDRAGEYARQKEAILATKRSEKGRFSLSPQSLLSVRSGEKIVLPSPNGSALSMSVKGVQTVCGCLRNAKAVAAYCLRNGERISVIAAGERWHASGNLRVAMEDLIGAGAIIKFLGTKLSPEANYARKTFEHHVSNMSTTIKHCSSGRELTERGFQEDVDLAVKLNVSGSVPVLLDDAYVDLSPGI